MPDTRYSRYYTYIKPVIGNKYVRSFAPYIFSLIALIVFTIFAIRPTVLTIIELQKSIEDHQTTLNLLEQKSKDLTDGKRNLDNMDLELKNKINTRLPNSPTVSNLINNLQTSALGIASVSALQVQPVTIYDDTAMAKPELILSELIFSFNTQGSFTQLISVLDNLYKIPRLINFTNTTLSRTKEGVNLSISGKSYYLKQ